MKTRFEKSEYLEKYGFEIPFTDKELSMIGKDVEFCKGENEEVENKGVVTDVRFGDSVFVENEKKYLSVNFAIGDWWSRDFPTDILAPPIYEDHTNNLLNEAIKNIKP